MVLDDSGELFSPVLIKSARNVRATFWVLECRSRRISLLEAQRIQRLSRGHIFIVATSIRNSRALTHDAGRDFEHAIVFGRNPPCAAAARFLRHPHFFVSNYFPTQTLPDRVQLKIFHRAIAMSTIFLLRSRPRPMSHRLVFLTRIYDRGSHSHYDAFAGEEKNISTFMFNQPVSMPACQPEADVPGGFC